MSAISRVPRLLNVEDNEPTRRTFSQLLRQAGFDVQEAATGEEAMRLVAQRPDLVLLDVNLADGIGGLEVCRRIKADSSTAHIPVVLVSGVAMDTQARVRGLEEGADEYLTKPIDPDLTVAHIKALLRARRAESERDRLFDQLRLHIERMPLAYILFDAGLRITEWNPAAERLLGFNRQEMLGTAPIEKLIPPSSQEQVQTVLRRIQAGDMSAHSVNHITTKEGRVLTCEWFNTPFKDEQDRFSGFLALGRDVTQQQHEKELLVRDALLLANVRDSVVMTDLNGVITYWNEGATRLFGWTAAERLGRNYADRFPEPMRSFVAANIAAEAHGSDWNGEFEDYRKDGSRVWIDARVSRVNDGEGKPLGILGVAHDVSARKRAEAALEQGSLRLRAVLSSLVDGLVVAAPDGEMLDWNPAALKLHGYGSVADVRRQLADFATTFVLSPPGGQPLAYEEWPLVRVLRGQTFTDCELHVRRLDTGKEWYISYGGVPVFNAAGELELAVLTLHDVTERRRLEEQFRQAQKMEAIGQLAGGVAHDFNNLLTVMNGYSELVLAMLPEQHPARELLLEIPKAGERAAALTRQLLAFSRQQVLAPEVVDLNAVVADLEKMLRRVIGEDVELTTILEPDLGHLKADIGQLEQIVMNLSVNARDAMPTGGKLTIETRNVDLDEAYFQGRGQGVPGRYIVLTVADTGHGMTAEVKAHIFEPFFTTKEKGKGTGLGLAMVYGAVQQNGGHIEVFSEPGTGTAFNIYLPRTADVIRASKSQRGTLSAPRGTETVLLVEDEEGVRYLARLILRNSGYTVVEAANGDDALRLAEQHAAPIHLLVSDVVMPHLGGRQLAERLLVLHPEAKVLFLSGYTDDAVVRHGILHEQVNFLQKPFTSSALAQKVREVLDMPT